MSEFLPNLERALMEGRGFADEFRKLMKIPRSTGSDPNEEQTTADIETEQVADSVDAINPIDKSITLHKITMDEDLLFKFSTMYLFNGITPDSKSTRHLNYLTSWIIEADKLFVVDLDAIPGRLERLQHVQVVVFINEKKLNFQIFIENNNRTTEVRNIFKRVYQQLNFTPDKSSETLWIDINSNYRKELQLFLETEIKGQSVDNWLIRQDCIDMGFQTRQFEVNISKTVAIGEHTKGTLKNKEIQQKTINTFYADDYLTVNDYNYARKLSTLEGYNYRDKNEETTFVKKGISYHLDVNWMAKNSFYEKFWDDKSKRRNLVAFIQDGAIELSKFFKDEVQNQIENNINVVAHCMYYVGNSEKKVFPTIRQFEKFISQRQMTEEFKNKIQKWKTEYFENLKQISNTGNKKSFEALSSKSKLTLRTIIDQNFPETNRIINKETLTVYEKTLMHYVRSLWLLDNTTIYQRREILTVTEDGENVYQNTNQETMIDQLFSNYHIISFFDIKYYKKFIDDLDHWNTSLTNHFAVKSGDEYQDVSKKTTNSFQIFPILNKESYEARDVVNNVPEWLNIKESLQYHFEMLTFPEMLHFVVLCLVYLPQLKSVVIEWSSLQISRYVNYLRLFKTNQKPSTDFQSIMDRIDRIPQIDDLKEFRGILEDCSKHLRQIFVKDKNTADELSKIWDISYHYFDNTESPKYGIGSIQSFRTSPETNDSFRQSRLDKDKDLRESIASRLSDGDIYESDSVNIKRILKHYQYLGGNMQLIILELISFKMKCLSNRINYNFQTFIQHLTDIHDKYESITTRFPGVASKALPHRPISDNLTPRSLNLKKVHVRNNSSWRKVKAHAYNILYHLRKEENSFFGAVPCTACPNSLQPNDSNLEIFFSYAFHVITCISRFVYTFTQREDETPERKWNITNLFVENYGHICSQIKAKKDSDSFRDDRAERLLQNSRHIISSDFECFELALKDLYKNPQLLNLLYLIKDGNEVIIQNAAKFVYGEEIDNNEYKKIYIYVQDQWQKGIFDLNQNQAFANLSSNSNELDFNDPVENVIKLYRRIANIFHEYVNTESFLSEKSGESDQMARVRNEKVLAIQKFCNLYFHPDIVESFSENVTQYANTHMKEKEKDLQTEFTNSMETKGNSDKFSALLKFGTDFLDTLEGQEFHETNIELYTYRKSLILYCQYLQQLLESTKPQDRETLLERTKTLRDDAIKLLPQRNA